MDVVTFPRRLSDMLARHDVTLLHWSEDGRYVLMHSQTADRVCLHLQEKSVSVMLYLMEVYGFKRQVLSMHGVPVHAFQHSKYVRGSSYQVLKIKLSSEIVDEWVVSGLEDPDIIYDFGAWGPETVQAIVSIGL